MIRLVIVEDHKLIRMMLSHIFQSGDTDIIVAGEAESGEALFALLDTTPADLVLLDINLPDMGGVEITQRLRKEYPNLKILAISAVNTTETIKAMLDAGIHGFISKQNGEANELIHAVHSVMSGLDYFGRDIAAVMLGVYMAKDKTSKLMPKFSKRERELIALCREGLTAKKIAERMNIKPTTVNTYKERVFYKLGISTTMEMVQYAMKHGIIRIES